ncbi:MAG TPA: ATP-binding cassette domain-containing protein, partial [Actinomycetes bacterium]|nr:ATP-binding cassette domain-containing protein [Actinomycetes bacterium]
MHLDTPTPPTTPVPVATFDGVTRRYGQVTAVNGLSLGIQPGQTVALLGPNGAGKTTAVELLLGLSAYSLILAGHNGFSQPDTAKQPGVWILTGFALFAVRDAAATMFGPRWGGRALAAM